MVVFFYIKAAKNRAAYIEERRKNFVDWLDIECIEMC